MTRQVQIITEGARRPSWQLIAAVPALLAMLISLALAGALVARRDSSQRTAVYEQDATAALAARDYARARVCFGRLLQLNPQDPRYRDGLAMSLQAMENQVKNRAQPEGK
jgi:hypothetical protein